MRVSKKGLSKRMSPRSNNAYGDEIIVSYEFNDS